MCLHFDVSGNKLAVLLSPCFVSSLFDAAPVPATAVDVVHRQLFVFREARDKMFEPRRERARRRSFAVASSLLAANDDMVMDSCTKRMKASPPPSAC